MLSECPCRSLRGVHSHRIHPSPVAMIRLPKTYSQRDPKWGMKEMGTSGLLLKDWGCTFTCGVMLAQAFAKDISMGDALRKMNEVGGFNAYGSLDWRKFAEVLGLDFGYRWDTEADPKIKFERVSEITGFRHVERLASWGIPTIAFVDNNRDGKPNHWVVYLGDGMVADPWDGQIKPMSTFKHLYGYAIMNGTPALSGGKMAPIVGKANDIAHGRNVALNAKEINQVVNRP